MTEIYGGALPDNAAAAAQPDMLSSSAAGGIMAALGEGFAHAFPTLELNRALHETMPSAEGDLAGIAEEENAQATTPPVQEPPELTPEEATKQYGIPGALRFDTPVPQDVAAEMSDRKREELARQDIINRSGLGLATRTAAQFAGSLPGIADPLMIASGFIPAVPAARAAIMSATLGGRLALGAIQGAVAGAALAPVFYGLAKHDQEDYGAVDALLNIALGGVAGGVGHAVFGREPGIHGETGGADDALAHVEPAATIAAAEAPADVREAMLTGSIAALADDRPVDLPARLLEETTPGATPYERLPGEPMRLASWLQQQGGVIDEGGDIAASGGRARPGLINAAGVPLDEATLRAWQEGYLPGDERPDVNTLLDAVNNDLHGNPVYSDQDELQAIAHRDALARNAEIDRYAQDFGISTEDKTRAQFWDAVADHLSQDDLAREIASHDEAHQTAFADAERRAQQWAATRGEVWEPDHDVGTPRTLDEMEQSYRSEEIARTSATGDRGAGRAGPAGFDQGALQAGDRSRGGGLGARQRGIDEGQPGGFEAEIEEPTDIEQDIAALETELRDALANDPSSASFLSGEPRPYRSTAARVVEGIIGVPGKIRREVGEIRASWREQERAARGLETPAKPIEPARPLALDEPGLSDEERELRQQIAEHEAARPGEAAEAALTAINDAFAAEEDRARAIERAGFCLARRA